MFGVSRFTRFFLILTALIIVPTLYLLYPSHSTPRSPGDAIYEYEAGGIDSPHWRAPVQPDFEQEKVRDWEDNDACAVGEDCDGAEGMQRTLLDKEKEKGRSIEGLEENVSGGGVIMPKLENATAKSVIASLTAEIFAVSKKTITDVLYRAELGRAAWKVLHLMTLRFPDVRASFLMDPSPIADRYPSQEPTPDDRTALKTYFQLFARLYPCGECAAEFQALLKDYPPQVCSWSRSQVLPRADFESDVFQKSGISMVVSYP